MLTSQEWHGQRILSMTLMWDALRPSLPLRLNSVWIPSVGITRQTILRGTLPLIWSELSDSSFMEGTSPGSRGCLIELPSMLTISSGESRLPTSWWVPSTLLTTISWGRLMKISSKERSTKFWGQRSHKSYHAKIAQSVLNFRSQFLMAGGCDSLSPASSLWTSASLTPTFSIGLNPSRRRRESSPMRISTSLSRTSRSLTSRASHRTYPSMRRIPYSKPSTRLISISFTRKKDLKRVRCMPSHKIYPPSSSPITTNSFSWPPWSSSSTQISTTKTW